MICAGEVARVEAGVVRGAEDTPPLRAPVQLVVTLGVGHQAALPPRHGAAPAPAPV